MDDDVINIFLLLLFLLLLISATTGYAFLYYNSAMEKVITVKEKWVKYYGGGAKYLFSDTEGNVYSVEDSWLLLKFDASDRYAKLEAGKTYRVRLYGWRIRLLSWYQNAVEVEPMEVR